MLLDDKVAVIYGGAGAIGSAVAHTFAREGARVFLAGRTAETLDAVARDIRAAGGAAESAVVDALDDRAVDAHADAVVAQTGRLDISFNLIDHGVKQGIPMAEMQPDDYVGPVEIAVRSAFVTARAAARHMTRRRDGVILAFGGEGDPPRGYHLGSLQVCFHAIEAMRRQLASELGEYGVRVVTLRTGGIPESIAPGVDGRDAIARSIAESSLLGRAATLQDVGDVAAFVASDRARTMTAATVNVSAGALID